GRCGGGGGRGRRFRAACAGAISPAGNTGRARFSPLTPRRAPPPFAFSRLSHPPVTFIHERLKVEDRMPAAQAFIREHKLNEMIPGDRDDIGIVVMGGLSNSVLRALERLGLADIFGTTRVPVLVLNVVYPLVPEELRA